MVLDNAKHMKSLPFRYFPEIPQSDNWNAFKYAASIRTNEYHRIIIPIVVSIIDISHA